jgi:hypothetical protein
MLDCPAAPGPPDYDGGSRPAGALTAKALANTERAARRADDAPNGGRARLVA